MKPTLSIIIASYNTKDLLLKCLDSIFDKDQGVAFEVIVVDDASTDGSGEALQNYRNGKIRLIINASNLGYAKSNNKGFREALGQYVLLLNSDTVVKANSLKKLIEFAQNTSGVGVVGAKLLNVDGSVQPSCFHFPTIKNALLEYWFGKKGSFEKYTPECDKACAVDSVVGAVFLITPKALKNVGLLDERYKYYFEDIDYCRRVKKSGLKVYYLPGSEVIHYHGASFAKLADKSHQWKRLIPSSKLYHGLFYYYLLSLVIWLGQKWSRLLKKS